MKIKFNNDVLIVYLYNKELSLDNYQNLITEIKNIFKKINMYYEIALSGMYKVKIYQNSYYGHIIEIVKIRDFSLSDYLDIKIEIVRNCSFYLMVDNYNYMDQAVNIYFYNNKYYIDIKEIKNINQVIELGEIIYKKNDFNLYKSVNVRKKSVN